MNISPGQFFRLLADETRLRSLLLMQHEGELCVCELTYVLDEIQPKVSRHLAVLRDSGVVVHRRQGQWVYYQLHPDLPTWARQVIAAAAAESETSAPYQNDRLVLKAMPDRPRAICRA